MHRSLLPKVFAAALAVAMCAPVSAQTTGQIRGQVVDQDGGALPGVNVTLTGQPIPGRRMTTVTGTSGNFAYSGLAIGKYTVSTAISGFAPQSSEIAVQLDGIAKVTFKLRMDTLKADVTVRAAEVPLVDVAATSTSTNFTAEFAEVVPTRGNFYDLIKLSPGVAAPTASSSRMGGFGSNVTSQTWNIDGMNSSSTEEGSLAWSLNPEIIAETQVMGTGAGAQYGNMLGNVTNVITRTGTNSFKGSLMFLYTNDALSGTNVTLPNSQWPTAHTSYYEDGSVWLGGPILRDKAWFFVAAEGRRWKANGPGVDPGLVQESSLNRYDFKLTSQLTSSHRLNAQGHFSRSDYPGAPDRYVEDTGKSTAKQDMVNFDYSGVLSPTTFVEAHAGYWQGDNNVVSQTDSRQANKIISHIPGVPSQTTGRMFWETYRDFSRTAADVSITHFADNFIKGSHQVSAGLQLNDGSAKRKTANTGFGWTQAANNAQGYTEYFWQATPPFYYGADTQSYSAFVLDSWTVTSNLTVDLGLRYDYNNGSIPDFPLLASAPLDGATGTRPGFPNQGVETGQTIPGAKNVIQWHNNWSPRFGFAWQPGGDGRTVIRGNAGLFIDGPVSSAWYAPPPGRGPEEYYILLASGSWYKYASKAVAATSIDPNVKPAKTWQYSLGIDRQIGESWAVGAMGIFKDTKDQIGWQVGYDGQYTPFTFTDPITGQTMTLLSTVKQPTLTKGNSTGDVLGGDRNYSQQYWGLVLMARKRLRNNWEFFGSYTLSKATGIEVRPGDSGGSGQGLPNYTSAIGGDPNQWINSGGLLTGDRRHMLRLLGAYHLGHGFRVSGTVNVQSGRPYVRTAQVTPPKGPANAVPMEVANDGQRYDTSSVVDLAVGKTFTVGVVAIDLNLQVLNLFNDAAVEAWASRNLYAGQTYVANDWVSPRQARITARVSF
jgi:outer membrane receptor protein involved in Fe transport